MAGLVVPEPLALEKLLWDLGCLRVAGVDEVGIGPLAGPVVAAAVVFPAAHAGGLDVADSKKLSAKRREQLALQIRGTAESAAVGVVEVEEVDGLGVHAAGLEAMRRAVLALGETDYLLVDARTIPEVETRQMAYVKADSFIYSVASASIIAKVYRDDLMTRLDGEFPGYGFSRHMGYGTAAHMEALDRLGPCAIHRRSFEPVRRRLHGDG